MKLSIAITLALVPLAANADALADLRASLVRLTAATPVRGTLEVTSVNRNGDDDRAAPGRAVVSFESGEAGLQLLYPRPLLAQAAQEGRGEAIDPERETPARSGVVQVRPLHLAELLDAASALTVMLENARLQEASPNLLIFKVTPKLTKAQSKRVRKLESTLSVRLGEDGIPISAERTTIAKASMLLLSFESEQEERWTYTRAGDRLIATRYESTRKSDGLGQHQSSQTTEVLRLQP